jgi:hypothetical protein
MSIALGSGAFDLPRPFGGEGVRRKVARSAPNPLPQRGEGEQSAPLAGTTNAKIENKRVPWQRILSGKGPARILRLEDWKKPIKLLQFA